MENQKEPFLKKKQVFLRKKVVTAISMFVVVLGAGAYLLWSKNAHSFLRQGSVIAVKSFEDIFSPSASGTIASEIDLASPSTLGVTNGESDEASSSVTAYVSVEKSGGYFALPQGAKKNRIAAASGTAVEGRNDSTANSTSVASVPAPQTVLPEPSSIAENSSVGVFPPDVNMNDDTGDSSAAAGNGSASCSFPVSVPAGISRRVILNEIAWMGSPTVAGETADHAANREWMELKNISGAEVSLDGWRIMDASGKIKISFGSGDALAPGVFYLLSRNGGSVSGLSADKAYTGTLPNNGGELAVLDAVCGVSDFLDASAKWPGGSNVTKQTLERKADLDWQTSAAVGGTPHVENSVGVPAMSATSSSTEKYEVNITIAGDGGGEVTMKPGGTICKMSCTNEYTKGTAVALAASPGGGADFVGWSGGCSGISGCSFIVGGPVSVVAGFRLNTDGLLMINNNIGVSTSSADNDTAENTSSSLSDGTNIANSNSSIDGTENGSLTPTSSPPSVVSTTSSPPSAMPTVDHLVVAAIEIAGAAANDDFVKIYNPTQNAVDISGWKLRKKSSTGTDSSLREFPNGSAIVSGGYFTWASSANGFAQSIGADASSTGTLAVSNSVALFDGNGTQVDAVAWGTGTNQYVEGLPYPDNPTANQVLERKFANGEVVDTDNNADDFTL